MKKVTIMIPTYNQEEYIGQAIESALAQNYENLEIIVSDDCSTDNTKEVVSKYLSDKRVKYYKNEQNLGRVGNYRKTLYDYSSGDYVLNLDGDDWLKNSHFIDKAVELLDTNENMSCVFGDRENYYESSGKSEQFTNTNNTEVENIMDGNNLFLKMPLIGFVFSHFACLYKREYALNLNFYSKNILSADSESIMKLFLGHEVGYLPYVVGVWRMHTINASHLSIQEKYENLSRYDSLYEFASLNSMIDKSKLDAWLIKVKSNTLSQELLSYYGHGNILSGNKFLLKLFTLSPKIWSRTLLFVMQKIAKKILR